MRAAFIHMYMCMPVRTYVRTGSQWDLQFFPVDSTEVASWQLKARLHRRRIALTPRAAGTQSGDSDSVCSSGQKAKLLLLAERLTAKERQSHFLNSPFKNA